MLRLFSGDRYERNNSRGEQIFATAFRQLSVKASTWTSFLIAVEFWNGPSIKQIINLFDEEELQWARKHKVGANGGKWIGETSSKRGYDEIQIKGNQVLKTWWFAKVHDILRPGISIHFVYLKLLSYVFQQQQQILSVVSCPGSPQTSWALEEIKCMSFQRVKNIQYQPPTQKCPWAFKYAKQCQGFAVWYKLISWFCHKGVFYVTKPCDSEHHELLKPRQLRYSVKVTYWGCLRVLMLNMFLNVNGYLA